MGAQEQTQRSRALVDQLATRLNQLPKMIVAIFMPHAGEPDIKELVQRTHHRFCLPVVIGKAAPLQFASWEMNDDMVDGVYGIATPLDKHWVQPDLLLIPCLGFSAEQARLGYGGGYYDRTLAQYRSEEKTVQAWGVAWRQSKCDFAMNEHDIAMNEFCLA